jgi:NADPH:quinone reductase-like Zn-dependent oxidoreductase
MFEAGKISPLIGAQYPLEEYAKALNCLAERKAIGKVVVNI